MGILLGAIKELQLKPFCSARNADALPLAVHFVPLQGIIIKKRKKKGEELHSNKGGGWRGIIHSERG